MTQGPEGASSPAPISEPSTLSSPPSWTASSQPSEAPLMEGSGNEESKGEEASIEAEVAAMRVPAQPRRLLPLGLFLATVVSVLHVGGMGTDEAPLLKHILSGWTFALPLLSILLAHEFGHFFAAKIHRVPASLPYFLPMPYSPL